MKMLFLGVAIGLLIGISLHRWVLKARLKIEQSAIRSMIDDSNKFETPITENMVKKETLAGVEKKWKETFDEEFGDYVLDYYSHKEKEAE